MKSFLAGVGCLGIVAVLILGTAGMAVAGYGLDWFLAPFKGAQAARQTIQADGDFRIQA